MLAALGWLVLTLVAAGVLALLGRLRWWWAAGAGLAAYLLLAWWSRRRGTAGLRRWLRARGRVLRGAEVVVHSVEPASQNEVPEWSIEDFDAERHLLHRIELTVTPATPADGPASWEPGSLRWLPPGARVHPRGDERLVPRGSLDLEVAQNGRFETLGDSHLGPARLRALIQAPRGIRSVRLAYFYEILATIPLAGSETGGSE